MSERDLSSGLGIPWEARACSSVVRVQYIAQDCQQGCQAFLYLFRFNNKTDAGKWVREQRAGEVGESDERRCVLQHASPRHSGNEAGRQRQVSRVAVGGSARTQVRYATDSTSEAEGNFSLSMKRKRKSLTTGHFLPFSGSEMLKKLHSRFTEVVSSRGFQTLSFSEGAKTDIPFKMKEFLVPPEFSGESKMCLPQVKEVSDMPASEPFGLERTQVTSQMAQMHMSRTEAFLARVRKHFFRQNRLRINFEHCKVAKLGAPCEFVERSFGCKMGDIPSRAEQLENFGYCHKVTRFTEDQQRSVLSQDPRHC